METESERNIESNPAKAEAHIKSAHQTLKRAAREDRRASRNGSAITKLKTAVNDLAIQTGGLL